MNSTSIATLSNRMPATAYPASRQGGDFPPGERAASVARARTLCCVALAMALAAHLQGQATGSASPGISLPERPSERIAKKVPQFGGMFIGSDKALNYYVLETSLAVTAAAETAIMETLGTHRIPAAGFRPIKGRYGYLQLKQWHDRHRLTTLAMPGVILTSVKESKNRLLIGVQEAGVALTIKPSLAGIGIPWEAVEIEVTEPFRPLSGSLRDQVRPIVGGIEISRGCTLSVLAVRQGVAGFVTASHCTNVEGAMDGGTTTQPNSDAGRIIGVETVDPPYTTANCPSGRKCRYSDAAFIRRSAPIPQDSPLVQGDLGYIAMVSLNAVGMFDLPDTSPYLTMMGRFRIMSKGMTSFGLPEFPIEGMMLTKVGRTTGMTEGEVYDTCVDINKATTDGKPTDKTLLCQDRVAAVGRGGG